MNLQVGRYSWRYGNANLWCINNDRCLKSIVYNLKLQLARQQIKTEEVVVKFTLQVYMYIGAYTSDPIRIKFIFSQGWVAQQCHVKNMNVDTSTIIAIVDIAQGCCWHHYWHENDILKQGGKKYLGRYSYINLTSLTLSTSLFLRRKEFQCIVKRTYKKIP